MLWDICTPFADVLTVTGVIKSCPANSQTGGVDGTSGEVNEGRRSQGAQMLEDMERKQKVQDGRKVMLRGKRQININELA